MIDIENLMAAMAHRRSFKPAMLRQDAVPKELIEKILEAANWAPSHGQTEPWRFGVFMGEGRNKLVDLIGEAQREKAFAAPVWIAIGMQPAMLSDGKLKMSLEEEEMAVACAVQNMHLMASALGLGAKWTTNAAMMQPRVAELLGLKAPGKLLGFFFVGWPAVEWPEGKRGAVGDKVVWAE